MEGKTHTHTHPKGDLHAGEGAALRLTTLWSPQAVDTVKTDPSLSSEKVVCTPAKVVVMVVVGDQ